MSEHYGFPKPLLVIEGDGTCGDCEIGQGVLLSDGTALLRTAGDNPTWEVHPNGAASIRDKFPTCTLIAPAIADGACENCGEDYEQGDPVAWLDIETFRHAAGCD